MKDAAAAGIGPLPDEGVPAAWTLYFASDDANATATTVREHGGLTWEDLRSPDPEAARVRHRVRLPQ